MNRWLALPIISLVACNPEPTLSVQVVASPISLDFSQVLADENGRWLDLVVENTDSTDALLQGYSFAGAGADFVFLQKPGLPLALSVSSPVSLRVFLKDSARAGNETATLTLNVQGYRGLGAKEDLLIPVNLGPIEDCDQDGDSNTSLQCGGDDCDDTDPQVNPQGVEICDGVDQDCNGLTDDNVPGEAPWYLDSDGDGFGDSSQITSWCDPIQMTDTRVGEDCDDTDPQSHPGAEDLPNDLVDQDCNGILTLDPANACVGLSELEPLAPGNYEGTLAAHTNTFDPIDHPSCTGWGAPGKDGAFPVHLEDQMTFFATATVSGDASIYLVSDCNDLNTCLVGSDVGIGSASPETIRFTNQSGAAQDYVLVIDAQSQHTKEFTLFVDVVN